MNNQEKRRTVIGKSALVIAAAGEKAMAAQIFNYDHVREVRLDLPTLEVKLLMTYDDAYFRVFSTQPASDSPEDVKKAQDLVSKFYNDLINASMKLTQEELDNLQAQNKPAEKTEEK